MPAMPIAEISAPIVVGIRQTSSAISTGIGMRRAGVVRERLSVTTTSRKTSVSTASRMLSAISFGVFCRTAPSTSAIMRSRNVSPGFDVILHHDPVRQHLRAAGHRGAIAAGLADHRRRFAGDRRFVDAGDAFDDLAVAGNHLAGLDADDVAGAQRAGVDRLALAAGEHANGRGLGLRLAQRGRLRLAAPFGHRLGEVGEQHGEPEPERDLPGKQRLAGAAEQLLDPDDRRHQAADLDDEHHRVPDLDPRIELAERVGDRLPTMPDPRSRSCVRVLPCTVHRRWSDDAPVSRTARSSARFSSSTLTRARPRNPSVGGSVWAAISSRTRAGTSAFRLRATRARLQRRPRPAGCADRARRRSPSPSPTAPGSAVDPFLRR